MILFVVEKLNIHVEKSEKFKNNKFGCLKG